MKQYPDRLKIVSIDARLLVDIFNWWRYPPHWIALPINDELPEDCEVMTVNANWERRVIEAVVYSESFPPVPEGAKPPMIPGVIQELRTVQFQQARDKADVTKDLTRDQKEFRDTYALGKALNNEGQKELLQLAEQIGMGRAKVIASEVDTGVFFQEMLQSEKSSEQEA